MNNQIQTVDVNGKPATLLVADLNDGQKLSVITNSLLQRLVKLLPKADVKQIMLDFAKKVEDHANYDLEHDKLELIQFTDMLTEELDFHKSVNLINEFFIKENEPESVQAH